MASFRKVISQHCSHVPVFFWNKPAASFMFCLHLGDSVLASHSSGNVNVTATSQLICQLRFNEVFSIAFGRRLSCHGRSQPCSVHTLILCIVQKHVLPLCQGPKMRSLVTFSDIERGFAWLLRVKLQAPAVWGALQILYYASDFISCFTKKKTPQAKRVTCFTRLRYVNWPATALSLFRMMLARN